MAASNELLGQLHAVVAEKLIDIIKNGVPVEKVDKEGEVTTVNRAATAAELTAAITFLKNNSITSSIEEDEALADMHKLLKDVQRGGRRPELEMPDVHSD